MTTAQSVPEATAERFVAALGGLVSSVREVLAAAGDNPQAAVWQRKLLPLLESRLAAANAAAAGFAASDQQRLVEVALPLRFLARDLDGYALTFAGDAFAAQLQERQRLVVFAAWQVGQAAGAV